MYLCLGLTVTGAGADLVFRLSPCTAGCVAAVQCRMLGLRAEFVGKSIDSNQAGNPLQHNLVISSNARTETRGCKGLKHFKQLLLLSV